MKKYNIYRDYYELPFTKIYWSRLAGIHIDRPTGEYRCDCCRKEPHLCDNKESAKEYDKIRQVIETDEGFGCSNYLFPIKETGYLRADMFQSAQTIWRVQRELAKSAGFRLFRSPFV